MVRLVRLCVLILLLPVCVAPAQAQSKFATIDNLVQQGIDQHRIPGAVVVIAHNGHVVFRKAYGHRALVPTEEPMTLNTVFDMASLTKPAMTALAVMQLVRQGKVDVDAPVARYIPEFGANGKGSITVRDLLTHYSGLPPDLGLADPWEGKGEAFRLAFNSVPAGPPGEKFVYSDINFIVLGALVERLSGLPLDVYAERHIITPLALKHTRYLPPDSWLPLIAPTEYEHGKSASGVTGIGTGANDVVLRGVVHDPTARRMGGVAGHAGLFSTGDDVAAYAQALLDRRAGRPSRFPLSRKLLLAMTTPEQPAGGKALRGFGWDIDSPYSSNRGKIFPVGSFGHTGFTGTSLWIDPKSDTYVVILTNAVHPNGPTGITQMRSHIADAAATALGLYPSTTGRATAQRVSQQ